MSPTQLPALPVVVSTASPLESVDTVPSPTSQDCPAQNDDVWFHDLSVAPVAFSITPPA